MTKRRMKYNPSFLTETELVENFVVRHADLEIIMGTISENLTDSNQHVLVIGPRGSGKTTLVHRVAAEIGRNADLREHWYPLIFSEESYEVVTAGEFWLEALFHLSGQTGDEKWKRTHDELKSETDDQRLANRALSQLLDFADSQGKRLLLIVENLNMLFEDLTSDDEAWKIRHTLINEPRLMLLATATCRFEHVENSSQAMFEMFKMHELKPLDDDECNRIWEMITGQKMLGERIKPLRILTGGNPRLLTIISKFSAHRSFRKLLDDLVDLIDDHTEYFKSHLDNLPATERKVYLALAGLWDASTAREIAQAARLDVSKTSSLLGRLVNRGAVAVEEHGKKSKWYVVAERMYNIYYLMRRRGKPADRVKATVKFLVSMYDPESAARLIVDEACGLSPELRRDHCLAYEATIADISDKKTMKRIIKSTPQYFLESPYFNQNADDFALRKSFGHTSQITTKVKKICKHCKDSLKYMEEGHYEQAIDLLDKIIKKYCDATDGTLLECVAIAMVNKGFVLSQSNRSDEAIAVYDALIARFKDTDDAALYEPVAKAMVNKGNALSRSNRSDEAIAVYDELIARFKDADDAALYEPVAKAMVNKGFVLSQSNRSDEAIAVYDELIARFKDADDAALYEPVATAMVNKGFVLSQSNRSDEAIAVYDALIARFKDTDDAALYEPVAKAMVNKGNALSRSNRSDEAIAVYDELIARFKDVDDAALHEQVANAMVNKGFALGQLNRSDEAIAVYDELIARFKDVDEAALHEQVANAMVNKGNALSRSNRSDEAIAVYDELIARFKDADDAALYEPVATAMGNKGFALRQSNRSDEAVAVYDELIARFKDVDDAALHEQVANAMVNKGFALGQLNRSDEAIAVYDELIARFKDVDEAALHEQVANAMVNKGFALGQLNRSDEAIAVYDELIARFKDVDDAPLRKQVANAMFNKGVALEQLNRSDEAVAVYDELIARFKDADEAALHELVATAYFFKGKLLDSSNNYAETEYCFRRAREFAPENMQFVIALIELLLIKTTKYSDAVKTAEEAIGKAPDNPELLNGISWVFYGSHDPTMLTKAVEWSKKAVSLSPAKPHIRHTLACILSALGKGGEALTHAKAYIQDTQFVEKTIEDAIELFVELAAAGQSKEALKLLLDSEASKHLEPLVVGLSMFTGENVKTAPEIKEVAKDVIKRIETRMEKRGQEHPE